MPIYNLAYGSQNRPGISGTPQANSHLLQMTIYRINTPGPTPWTPGANTLIYLPLNGDATNLGTYGTSGDGTLPSSTYYSWEYINGSSGNKYFYSYSSASNLANQAQIQGSYGSTALGSGNRTVSIWMKIIEGINSSQNYPMYIGMANGGTQGEWFGLWIMDESSSKLGIIRYYSDPYTNGWTYNNNWHNYICTYSETNKAKMYVDGNQVTMTNNANVSFNTIGTNYFIGTGKGNGKRLGLSNFIIEDKEWTATEVENYYNATRAYYEEITPIITYTISNIPTSDTNVYQNVAQSSKTIDSVKFSFTAQYLSAQGFFQISGNNSSTNRYGLVFGRNTSGTAPAMAIRGRLGGSDTYYRSITDGFDSSENNVIEYTINRSGSCSVKCNGTTSTYTATGTELTVLQTIMNLSDMNVYCAQNGGSAGSVIVGNTVDIEVTYS